MGYPKLLTEAGAVSLRARDAVNALISSQGILTQGNVWWVRPVNGNDSNDGLSPFSAFQTLSKAQSAAVANQNDVVVLCAENSTAAGSTAYQGSVLTWAKNMVHLVGVNAGAFLGQRSRIANTASAAVFTNLFTLSASGCLIAGVEFYQGAMATNPSAASTCVTVSGSRNHFLNCQISGVGDSTLDDTGANDLTVSGEENLFQHCYIGLDTVIRASALAGVVMSGANTRNVFEDCHFAAYTSSTSYKFVSVATTTDRFVKFKNCEFSATPNITSSAAPSGAIGITTMNGACIVMNCGFFNITQIVTADNAYVQVLGFNGLATGHLTGIAQGVDAA